MIAMPPVDFWQLCKVHQICSTPPDRLAGLREAVLPRKGKGTKWDRKGTGKGMERGEEETEGEGSGGDESRNTPPA